MRAPIAAVCALVLLSACDRTPRERSREYRRVTATVESTIPGVHAVDGGPVCVETELRGGAYGKRRYEVYVMFATERGRGISTPPGVPPKVFYDVHLEAGGRAYDGYLSSQTVQMIPGTDLTVSPPDTLGEMGSSRVEPQNYVGVQQIPADLTACRITVRTPDAAAVAAGGRLLPEVKEESVVVDPDGTARSMGLE